MPLPFDMDITKHSPGARPIEYIGCCRQSTFKTFPKGLQWMWTSHLSTTCIAVVLTTDKAAKFWHWSTKWPDNATPPTDQDPYLAWMQHIFDTEFKAWYRAEDESKALNSGAELYVVSPISRHADAINWFESALAREFGVPATEMKYNPAPANADPRWTVFELYHDAENDKPEVFLNGKPLKSKAAKPLPKADWGTASSNKGQESFKDTGNNSRKFGNAKKPARHDPNPHHRWSAYRQSHSDDNIVR